MIIMINNTFIMNHQSIRNYERLCKPTRGNREDCKLYQAKKYLFVWNSRQTAKSTPQQKIWLTLFPVNLILRSKKDVAKKSWQWDFRYEITKYSTGILQKQERECVHHLNRQCATSRQSLGKSFHHLRCPQIFASLTSRLFSVFFWKETQGFSII